MNRHQKRVLLECLDNLESGKASVAEVAPFMRAIIKAAKPAEEVPLNEALAQVARRFNTLAGLNTPTPDEIVHIVAREFGVSYETLQLRSRKVKHAEARWHCFWLIKLLHPATSLHAIGEMFGLDHGSTHHGLKRFTELYENEPQFRERADAIRKLVEAPAKSMVAALSAL